MNHLSFFKKSVFIGIFTIFSCIFAIGQAANSAAPKEHKLLNGLKLLVWNEPSAEKITVKLRVHSGSSFDPKDKMGVMALLVESLFPTEQSKAFFIEDLEGNLDISSNYDYLQITATGKSGEILTMLETISTAIIGTPLTPENFKLVSEARMKKVKELEQNPSYLADLAVAKRLLGNFPYGRSMEGTSESIAKIDRADLLYAKERFLTADNATLAVIGNVKPDYVYRVSRQLFGGWNKSEKKVPATFRQPDEPNQTMEIVEVKTPIDASEIRFATRGIARGDKDYFAMRIFADAMQSRFRSKIGKDLQEGVFVVHHRSLLPGVMSLKFSMGAVGEVKSVPVSSSDSATKTSINPISWLKVAVSDSEFAAARARVLSEIGQKPLADKMLDVDTYRLLSVKDEMQKLNSVTLLDVQRVADKVSKQPFVNISLKSSAVKP